MNLARVARTLEMRVLVLEAHGQTADVARVTAYAALLLNISLKESRLNTSMACDISWHVTVIHNVYVYCASIRYT